ncbi:restriction endonuclease [Pectobacterium parmentieri]|uniref:McrC family protein n=1 Tax=Pectobacterium parmentieri TaxID=1905730 RepID=UPI000EAD9653|nr:McrC family protein [Pectobacterium parmentieri]RKO82043.1 restriction endonuclease [Pectobacterium parmentieri]
MGKVVSVFEYGLLGVGKALPPAVTAIPPEVFSYLESLALDEQGSAFLRLTSRSGHRVLQVQNYAGVLYTPHGVQLEVLPKVGRRLTPERARETLLVMLSYLSGFRHIEAQQASVQAKNMPLLEIFVAQFLHSVSRLLKQGLRAEYVREQGNLAFMKGKLMFSQQLRHNLVNRHKFWVDYEEYLPDCPANRLVHAALLRLSHVRLSSDNQRWCQELRFAFEGITPSQDIDGDIARLRPERGLSHYDEPLAWAQLILQGISPLALQGDTKALSLLFPMEAVFESFVAQTIAEELPPHLLAKIQFSGQTLVHHVGKGRFKLRPDLLIQSRHPAKNQMILDTKWKLVSNVIKGQLLYGLSQNDFYQMFAYGQKYLEGKGDLYLIYPEHDGFTHPVAHHFGFSEELRLWVVPYRIMARSGERMAWCQSDCLVQAAVVSSCSET